MTLINKTNSRKFRQGLISQVRQRYRSVYPRIKSVLKDYFDQEMTKQFYANETVQSCINGVLRAELGLNVPEASLAVILQKMLSTLTINVSAPKDEKSILRITVQAVREDLEDLLGLAAGKQDWTDRRGTEIRGEPLPWLEWLLVEGGNVIISDYVVNKSGALGRSGMPALMEEKPGKFWKVPARFQGTRTDNFILDIVDKVEKALKKNLWQIVLPVLAQLS